MAEPSSFAQPLPLPLPGMLPGGGSPAGAFSDEAAVAASEVGQFVEYLFRRAGQRAVTVRYSLVERTTEGDWLETVYTRADGQRLLLRVLLDGRVDRPGRIRRLIVQQGRMQALELPADRGQAALPPRVPSSAEARILAEEDLRVGDRTIRARHVVASGPGGRRSEAWLSASVPLWGLARFFSPRHEMSLLSFGTGARSALVGEPVRFDPAELGGVELPAP